jgi:integral membrane sensor domain MASE1
MKLPTNRPAWLTLERLAKLPAKLAGRLPRFPDEIRLPIPERVRKSMPVFMRTTTFKLAMLYSLMIAAFSGALLAYLVVGRAFWPSLFIAGSNVIEPLLVAWVLQRMGRFSRRLETPQDFFKLMLAGALSAALAAAIGVMTLTAFGIVPFAHFPHGMLQWWMGNLLGIMLGAPLLLVWRGWPRRWFENPRRRLETVLFLTTSVLASQVLFGDWLHGAEVPRSYLMFLFASWGALRFGRRGATLIVLLAAGHGLLGALHGYGVFAADLQQTQLGNFWLYIMTLGFVGITLATTINAMFRNEETNHRQAP